jgi:hypothetical protein
MQKLSSFGVNSLLTLADEDYGAVYALYTHWPIQQFYEDETESDEKDEALELLALLDSAQLDIIKDADEVDIVPPSARSFVVSIDE